MTSPEQCDVCTRDGVIHDGDGRFLCEECLFEMHAGEDYEDHDFPGDDYADPD